MGLQRAQNEHGIGQILTADEDDLANAAAVAADADVVVIVAGYTAKEEGEFIPGDIALGQEVPAEARDAAHRVAIGGDRDDLGLPADQLRLIDVAVASGKPVIVVLVAGSAVMVEGWEAQVGAILQTFYSGMEGGTALARLLFGTVSPSGKLPFSVAREADHYPYFDKEAASIQYDLWHGYSKLDRDGNTPRHAFGHGLSYADFAYDDLVATCAGDGLNVQVTVANTGTVAADEVAQIYIGAPGVALERQSKLLKAFRRVSLQPGEAARLEFEIALDSLRWRNAKTHGWELERGDYRVMAGGSSDRLVEAGVTL